MNGKKCAALALALLIGLCAFAQAEGFTSLAGSDIEAAQYVPTVLENCDTVMYRALENENTPDFHYYGRWYGKDETGGIVTYGEDSFEGMQEYARAGVSYHAETTAHEVRYYARIYLGEDFERAMSGWLSEMSVYPDDTVSALTGADGSLAFAVYGNLDDGGLLAEEYAVDAATLRLISLCAFAEYDGERTQLLSLEVEPNAALPAPQELLDLVNAPTRKLTIVFEDGATQSFDVPAAFPIYLYEGDTPYVLYADETRETEITSIAMDADLTLYAAAE